MKKKKRKKIKPFNPARAKRSLDGLFSRLILSRDRRTCRRCGARGVKCDTAHIVPRELLATRWNPANAIALCVGCHKYGRFSLHKNPISFVRWYDRVFHNANALLALSTFKVKVTRALFEQMRNELKERINAL